jgi:8-oxo-dGTP diphosphatase
MLNRSVAAIIIHGDAVLLARRKPGGAIGGLWEFPGGKVDSLELPVEALKRELREELGVEAAVMELMAEGDFVHQGTPYRLSAYRVTVDSHDFRLSEHSETRWVGFDDVADFPLPESDRAVLPQILLRFR